MGLFAFMNGMSDSKSFRSVKVTKFSLGNIPVKIVENTSSRKLLEIRRRIKQH